MGGRILEITLILVMAYLIFINADGFSKAAEASGGVYINAVKALQGR